MPELILRRIVSLSPPENALFAHYQTTHDFYNEVGYRQALKQHCQWYQQVSAQHRREFEQMRQDIKILH